MTTLTHNISKSAVLFITKEGTEFKLNINEDEAQSYWFESMASLKNAIKFGIGENKTIDSLLNRAYRQFIWRIITEFFN